MTTLSIFRVILPILLFPFFTSASEYGGTIGAYVAQSDNIEINQTPLDVDNVWDDIKVSFSPEDYAKVDAIMKEIIRLIS